jgi:hypothetical protein
VAGFREKGNGIAASNVTLILAKDKKSVIGITDARSNKGKDNI